MRKKRTGERGECRSEGGSEEEGGGGTVVSRRVEGGREVKKKAGYGILSKSRGVGGEAKASSRKTKKK